MKTFFIAGIVAAAGFAAWFAFAPAPVGNLDGFATLTHEDPLFYSPFFDEAAFGASLHALQEAEMRLKESALKNIESLNSSTGKTYAALLRKHALFPHQFLAALAAVPPATDAFLAEPTPARARALLRLYEGAAEAYVAAAESALEVFEEIDRYVPPNRPLLYFFTDSVTSVKTVHADYRLILQNGQVLLEEVARRRACLAGRGPCEAEAAAEDTAESGAEFFAALDARPNLAGAAARFVRETLALDRATEEVRGPYPIDSGCWQSAGAPHWLYLTYAQDSGRVKATPKLATQNYYRLVSPAEKDRISQALTGRGLSFYRQTETTTYECTDLTFYPRLLALDFAQKQVEAGAVSRDELAADPHYRLLGQNQFGLMAPALEALAGYTRLLEASQRIGADFVLSPQFLFSTRSAYSLTFLPFAKSVWRLPQAPAYLLSQDERNRIQAPAQFATFTQLRARGFSESEIRKAHINQDELIRSLTN